MGSEHYCLRWNNHQSNLLGVFSQLLHDESLVDVTLACSEGASIRAHKVVLSACSSYFRSLFVDHPSRHPIVILKDVGLAELRTLVDFMYKGEVNVQYCQLPALLKTAESLQVKGLAEMTTLSAAGIDSRNVPEPMEECQPLDATKECPEHMSHERLEARESRDKDERQAKDPRDRENRDNRDRESHSHSRETRETRDSHREQKEPRDLRSPRDFRETRESREHRELREPRDLRDHRDSHSRDMRETRERDIREARGEARESRDPREVPEASPPRMSPLLSVRRFRTETSMETLAPTHPPIPKDEPPDEPMRPSSPEDDAVSIRSNGAQNDNSVGINMTINSHGGVLGPPYSPVDQRLSVLNAMPHPALVHPSHPALSSPRNEPIAGPSGLPPVQQVPLSLKKEVDWERSNEDKGGESSSDYRLHESMCLDMSCGAGGTGGAALGAGLGARPAALPLWSPLLALQACRLRRYLSDDCMAYQSRHILHSERRRCGVCLASFPSTWLLERHAALQHASQASCDDKPFVCEQCGQSYRYRSAYVKHREQNHRARLPADKLFTCDVCGMQFRYLKSFKKHRLNHTLERLHTKNTDAPEGADQVSSTNEALIGQCGEMDLSMKKKNRTEGTPPIEVIHDAEQDSTVDSNGATDSIVTVDDSTDCKTVNSGAESERRDDDIPDERRRVPVSFASVSSMADSSESESRGDSSKNESSSSQSGILGFLQNDDRQRDRERRFACPFCGKCVRSKENLKLHVRKHTGERPFVCLFCGRAFGGKSDLTRHLRIHTGERPYHCEACGKCFARADYLSKHLTTHVHNAR
ncbi:uncharacterized protein LOC126369497 [Pectinophora gossypiella]|uniref:uncharacterized protein LOC126369497 n=1 Tax=Pectinophora gossypiella TaxID=13191 RepID=UPI00214E3B38|nr:uncharacterized protein LOC126369497 [Pectinophora gossypiella]XP_049869895.1 uncharacterized protein LOC126369497 [Pectinophora gossypiella]